MKATVEPVEGNKVKVSVEVDSEAFEREVDAAFKRIAREVRIPGFRQGKAPRKLLEARIGLEAARGDAIEHSIPRFYSEAVIEHEVDVIAAPDYDLTSSVEDDHLTFEAVVEIRPTVNPAGYQSLRVTIDNPAVSDGELDEQIERLRNAYAQLESVERAAQDGDSVLIDVVGSRDGEELPGLVADGYLYEVGSGTIVPELDERLVGASADEVLEFTADHPTEGEEPIDFKVTVSEVREKSLPDLDDEFAAEASEFETLDELRSDLRARLTPFKRAQSAVQVRAKTSEALAELVEEDAPQVLVDQDVQHRLDELFGRLQAQGISPDQYLGTIEGGPQAFLDEMRAGSARAVKANLALRAIVVEQDLDVTQDEIDAQVELIARQAGEKPARVHKEFERTGQMAALRSEMKIQRAMDWLIEQVELVDEDGNAIDRTLLEPPSDDDGSPEDTE
ncbi:MAG: trigger factor [Acidimicrobiales bacterium]|nr:trigger factor [Acidimicrobiales bacterium]